MLDLEELKRLATADQFNVFPAAVVLELIERNAALKTALSYAIEEADGWHDDAHGGPVDTPEMQAARDLCK